MSGRNYQPGVLANAKNGVALHPQGIGLVAGGMAYRPQGGAPEGHESHTLDAEGSSPSPAPKVCPVLTKQGEECRGYPGEDGLCTGHRNAKLAAERDAE